MQTLPLFEGIMTDDGVDFFGVLDGIFGTDVVGGGPDQVDVQSFLSEQTLISLATSQGMLKITPLTSASTFFKAVMLALAPVNTKGSYRSVNHESEGQVKESLQWRGRCFTEKGCAGIGQWELSETRAPS